MNITTIPTPYATLKLCNACDVCGNFGCLDAHGLCDAVNPEQTHGCFRDLAHDGLHTFEIGRAVTNRDVGSPAAEVKGEAHAEG